MNDELVPEVIVLPKEVIDQIEHVRPGKVRYIACVYDVTDKTYTELYDYDTEAEAWERVENFSLYALQDHSKKVIKRYIEDEVIDYTPEA